MKKLIFGVFVLLVALTFLLMIYLKHPVMLPESKAAELVPADTVALLQFTDLQRSSDRFKETALYKIAHEPEVVAFLQKPRSKVPHDPKVEQDWAQAKKIEPKEAFVALTTISGSIPKFVAGFDYKGTRTDALALVTDLRSRLKDAFPAGKSDIVKSDTYEIETYEYNDVLIASVLKEHWFFVSNDMELLKSTLGRLAGKIDARTSLRDVAAYKSSLSKLPGSSDALLYVQPQSMVERLTTLISLSNPNFNMKEFDALKQIQAVSAGMKLDGANIRDAICILKPRKARASTMACNSLSLTSSQTLLYYAAVLNLAGNAPKLPDPSLDSTGILTILNALSQALQSEGLTFADFKAAFGPEISSIVDWPPGAMQPGLLLSIDVKDKAKAQKFVDTLTGGQAGLSSLAKQEIDGVPYYSFPSETAGFVSVAPALALTDKALVFGLSFDSVKSAVDQAKSGNARLDKSASYREAVGSVEKPTGAFGYIDAKALFERIYGLASNTVKMLAIFNPHANDYADLNKLPTTETISKHLTPIVYSMSADENGWLIESTGPVTFNQVAFGMGAGFGIAAFEKQSQVGATQRIPASPVTPPPPSASPAIPANPVPTIP